MKNTASIAAAALAIAVMPATALAQAAPQPQAQTQAAAKIATGATVYDAQGGEVGKVESVANGSAVVFTGTNRASIPLTSFAIGPKGPVLGMTRAELDAATQNSAATQVRSQLVPGAEVRGKNGAVLGKVKAVDGDNVVVATAANAEARVPITGFGVNAQGVFLGLTQAEFDAQVSASTAAQ
jgi:preprotein translocase subunit YajC